MTGTRTRLRNTLAHPRLAPPAPVLRLLWRAYERALAVRGRIAGSAPALGPDGVPLPPPELRVLVSGSADPSFFLDSGRAHSEFIRDLLAENGVGIEALGSLLDLGCGCGRIARWWRELDGPTIHGCDYNPRLVAWCAANLRFLHAASNDLRPPLPYPEASFDLVYAISILTHLREEHGREWVSELARVVKPGGMVLVTVNGRAYAETLSAPERARFDRGQVVTRFATVPGTNMCATYHPPAYVEGTMFGGELEIVDAVRPDEQPDRVALDLRQDAYLARRA